MKGFAYKFSKRPYIQEYDTGFYALLRPYKPPLDQYGGPGIVNMRDMNVLEQMQVVPINSTVPYSIYGPGGGYEGTDLEPLQDNKPPSGLDQFISGIKALAGVKGG